MILKPLEEEISFTSANTVYGAKLVRVYAAANSFVTVSGAEANTSFTMHQGSVEIVEKFPTDTITGTTTLRCTPVSYKT